MISSFASRLSKHQGVLRNIARAGTSQVLLTDTKQFASLSSFIGIRGLVSNVTTGHLDQARLFQQSSFRTFSSEIKGPDLDKEPEVDEVAEEQNTSEDFLHEEFQRLDIASSVEDRKHFVALYKKANSEQREFLMQQNAQPVNKSLFADEGPTLEEEMDDLGIDMTDMEMKVVKLKRTCKTTSMGGMYRYSALVVAGNKRGLIGYAIAKGEEPPTATQKAYRRALKNLHYFEFFNDNQTIWHESRAKFCKSIVHLMPGASETGLKCNKVIKTVCDLAGIKNIRAKVHGSHNPHNTLHATFKALNNIYTPEDVSALRGRYVEVY